MRVGIAHHYGWAIAVCADADHRVVDRRRIELIDEGLPAAPIHHEGGTWEQHRSGPPRSDDELAALVTEVRASVARCAAAALAALPAGITSLSVRDWPDDVPTDIAVLRKPPWEARVDSYMYCQVLAAAAADRGWAVHRYDAKRVAALTAGLPGNKDERLALAATMVA